MPGGRTAVPNIQMVALLQRLEGGIGLKVIFVGFSLGLFLGWIILSVGLLAARVVPKAIPVSVRIYLLLNFVGLELLSRLFFGDTESHPAIHATIPPAARTP